MLYQLVYYSISESEVTQEVLSNILDSFRKNNLKKNVTGCLIYHNKVFLQLLEGEKNDVIELIEIIKKDKRHHNFTLIINENINKRMFPGWNMAFIKQNNKPENKNFIDSIDFFTDNIPKKTESIDLFWRMAKQIVTNN